jgi:hypothetical protein
MDPRLETLDRSVDALASAMDAVDGWSADPSEGFSAPFRGLDEALVRSFILRAGAHVQSTEAALVFGLHMGAALARIVDDPAYGASLPQA